MESHRDGSFGRTHWDIFLSAFRRNRLAVAAFWVCVALLYLAVWTPFLSNNRPIVYHGKAPGIYRRSFGNLDGGAVAELAGLPADIATRLELWAHGDPSLADLKRDLPADWAELKERLDADFGAVEKVMGTIATRRSSGRMTFAELKRGIPPPERDVVDAVVHILRERLRGFAPEDPARAVYAAFIRAMRPIREGAQPNRPADVDAIRSALEEVVRGLDPRPDETLRREIEETMRRVEAVLGSGWTRPGPEALALMEEAPQRAIGAMAEIEEAILEQRARAIMGILEAMRGEVEEPARTRLREAASELKRMVREEYPRGRDADRSAWPQTVQRWWDGLRDGIHPDRVTIVERWHSPVLASLAPYDIFFLTASILLPLVVGPLRWVWLGRIRARRHRARIGAAIVLVPSALLAAGWAWKVPEQFETSSFREEIEAGNVIVRWALWPPHRWHYRDIVPMDEQAIRTKREHGGALPPSREHPLGTDMLDRDLLARLLWGGRISLTVGFVSASIALAIGTVLGALAGYYKGWVDNVVISRLTEWFMCFPVFFVVITMAAYTNNNMYVIMATIGALSWMGIQRLVRGEFLRLGNQDFVAAARALGAGNMRIMFRHILPNGLGPALIAASFGVASAILVESALGYLGFGVREPTPSWGSILNQMREARAWWVAVAPGFMIFLTVTAYNLVGDGIRDAIDPRLKT